MSPAASAAQHLDHGDRRQFGKPDRGLRGSDAVLQLDALRVIGAMIKKSSKERRTSVPLQSTQVVFDPRNSPTRSSTYAFISFAFCQVPASCARRVAPLTKAAQNSIISLEGRRAGPLRLHSQTVNTRQPASSNAFAVRSSRMRLPEIFLAQNSGRVDGAFNRYAGVAAAALG